MALGQFIVVIAACCALTACGGPKILAGDNDTVSITADTWDDVGTVAADYCRGYGKRAVALGNRPLGASTPRRLYAYNCVSPADPHT